MEQGINYYYFDEEQALEEFLENLEKSWETELDADGSRYNLALEFVKERNVKSDDYDGLCEVLNFIYSKEEALNDRLGELIDLDDEDRINELYQESAYYHRLSVGVITMLFDLGNKKIRA